MGPSWRPPRSAETPRGRSRRQAQRPRRSRRSNEASLLRLQELGRAQLLDRDQNHLLLEARGEKLEARGTKHALRVEHFDEPALAKAVHSFNDSQRGLHQLEDAPFIGGDALSNDLEPAV